MPRYKRPTKRSKNYVPGEIWDLALRFCRCYPLWIAELSVYDTSQAIRYDKPAIQTSGDYNPTEETAIRHSKLQGQVKIVEQAAEQTCQSETMTKFLIMGVTHGLSYETLDKQGIPCGRRMYYELRREMIYKVSQEIQ